MTVALPETPEDIRALTTPRKGVNILLMLAHSIEEFDQVRLLDGLGYNVFSIGAYLDPAHPGDDKRPALPLVRSFPDLAAEVSGLPDDPAWPDKQDRAKARIPDAILEWADVIICHHLEHRWLWPQWPRLRRKRVIWRTVGQSAHPNEMQAAPFVPQGLEIVRYSPREAAIPMFAGQAALIRFYKDQAEWGGWEGWDEGVVTVAQDLVGRAAFTNADWWRAATEGMRSVIIGPRSAEAAEAQRRQDAEESDRSGTGPLNHETLRRLLRGFAAGVWTGTQPASYTLGLIEMMMTGVPVVSIGPRHHSMLPYGPRLVEGHAIAPLWADSPLEAREDLRRLLGSVDYRAAVSRCARDRAVALFSRDRAEAAWSGWLDGHRTPEPDPEDLPELEDYE